MNKLLFSPHITFAVVISTCVAIDTACAGIMAAVTPLAQLHNLGDLVATINTVCVSIGVASNVGIALAGAGRSIVSAVDNAQPKDSAPPSVDAPAASGK